MESTILPPSLPPSRRPWTFSGSNDAATGITKPNNHHPLTPPSLPPSRRPWTLCDSNGAATRASSKALPRPLRPWQGEGGRKGGMEGRRTRRRRREGGGRRVGRIFFSGLSGRSCVFLWLGPPVMTRSSRCTGSGRRSIMRRMRCCGGREGGGSGREGGREEWECKSK